jgi:hypothetical protein
MFISVVEVLNLVLTLNYKWFLLRLWKLFKLFLSSEFLLSTCYDVVRYLCSTREQKLCLSILFQYQNMKLIFLKRIIKSLAPSPLISSIDLGRTVMSDRYRVWILLSDLKFTKSCYHTNIKTRSDDWCSH